MVDKLTIQQQVSMFVIYFFIVWLLVPNQEISSTFRGNSTMRGKRKCVFFSLVSLGHFFFAHQLLQSKVNLRNMHVFLVCLFVLSLPHYLYHPHKLLKSKVWLQIYPHWVEVNQLLNRGIFVWYFPLTTYISTTVFLSRIPSIDNESPPQSGRFVRLRPCLGETLSPH